MKEDRTWDEDELRELILFTQSLREENEELRAKVITMDAMVNKREAGGGEGVVFAGEEAEVEPFAEFGPCFGFKLGFGVGGDDSAGVGECAESPEGKLGDSCGFGNAMARGDGFLNGGVYVDKAIADSVH